MADSHPFANAGLSQFGADRNYASGNSNPAMGAFLAQYLAHKTGLIDLSDPTQKASIQKNGVAGHLLNGFMDKSIAPQTRNSIPAPIDSSPIVDNPGVAPLPVIGPLNPTSGNAGMDKQLSSFTQPPMDFHNFDTDIASYANMIDLNELGDLSSLVGFLA
jgi:hypothetical protein